jgi:hypothetical protein
VFLYKWLPVVGSLPFDHHLLTVSVWKCLRCVGLAFHNVDWFYFALGSGRPFTWLILAPKVHCAQLALHGMTFRKLPSYTYSVIRDVGGLGGCCSTKRPTLC